MSKGFRHFEMREPSHVKLSRSSRPDSLKALILLLHLLSKDIRCTVFICPMLHKYAATQYGLYMTDLEQINVEDQWGIDSELNQKIQISYYNLDLPGAVPTDPYPELCSLILLAIDSD